MIWISIIMAILGAVPELIKVIHDIIAAIHTKSPTAQLSLEHELKGHLLTWHRDRDHAGLKERLAALHQAALAAA